MLLNLKQMITYFLAHRREVVTRLTVFRLRKSREAGHILAGQPPCGIFSPRESRRLSGGSQGEGQGAARAQREGAKRCGNAAGIESHGIDQKPERQESARTGDRCASALAFFVFRVMSRSCRPACAEGLRWMRGVLT
nr:MAG TPA: DNA gyrase subunit A [Caudoviricetes sp.]